jgi:Smg protein
MMEVLAFVYENYGQGDNCPELKQLSDKLNSEGFDETEVEQALDWLEGLQEAAATLRRQRPNANKQASTLAWLAPQATSLRAYTSHELEHLGAEGLGFIHFLQAAGGLPPALHEVVMEHAVATSGRALTLEALKVIILMVFWQFNHQPNALVLDELCSSPTQRTLH